MFFLRRDYCWGAGKGSACPLRKLMRPRVASEQKVIGFEPNQRYVAN